MEARQPPKVAVLLATYNGARFVDTQIRSLMANNVEFTLHWLDDHSTDETRGIVRETALKSGQQLCEWHQPQHLGVPAVFFQLIESVDADIYLFCDQDDIWQPGKIDATVSDLLPDITLPTLCFSEPLLFDDYPGKLRRAFDLFGIDPETALQASRSLIACPAVGNTMGFTQPLRQLFLKNKDIARAHAFLHDWWIYLIAVASGTCRMLSDVPTTLYRRHGNNWSQDYFRRNLVGVDYVTSMWRNHQKVRRCLSRQARGFCLASETLISGPQLAQLVTVARLVSKIDRRQPLSTLVRLVRRGAMPARRENAVWIAATCLLCDAET